MFEFVDSDSDAELVRRAQAGDSEAFQKLLERYEKLTKAVAFGFLGNTHDAEEVCQEVFLQVFKKLGQLENVQAFVGWLKQITVRKSLSRLADRHVQTYGDLSVDELFEARGGSALDALLLKEVCEAIHAGMIRLKELDSKTLSAFHIDYHSINQMADSFKAPLGTIKRRLSVARGRLSKVVPQSLQP